MWNPFRRETRSGAGRSSYTDAVVSAILARAGGKTLAIPAAAACVEMASGFVCRAFAAAEVQETTETIKAALTSDCRGLVGRTMLRNGEALFLIRVAGGAIKLIPAESSTVTGDPDPDTWTYELTCGGPSGTKTYKHVPPESVLHFKYAFDPARPWEGVGPLQAGTLGGKLAANLAGSLSNEAGTPHGYLLPLPKDGQDASLTDLRDDLGKADGGLYTVETLSNSMRDGQGKGPAGWDSKRIGADVPPALVQLHECATREVLSMFGLSPALFGSSDGTSAREALRAALHTLIQPLARNVETELRRKLDSPDLTLDFAALSASDISGRARAFQSLVGAGASLQDAAANSGILITEA